jgi:hypothetical protein
MIDPGYESPFISRMPGVPVSMEDDRPPKYEYKDNLGPNDNPWEWEEQAEYGFLPPSIKYQVENSSSYQKRVDDGMWHLALWMAGICVVIMILYGLLS